MNSAKDYLAVAERLLAALNNNDGDAVRALYHPEASIWHNFHPGGFQSIEENVKTLHWMHRKMPKLHYEVLRLEPLENGYLQQHVLRGEMANGLQVALHACAICSVAGGRIIRLEEYLDPSQVDALRS